MLKLNIMWRNCTTSEQVNVIGRERIDTAQYYLSPVRREVALGADAWVRQDGRGVREGCRRGRVYTCTSPIRTGSQHGKDQLYCYAGAQSAVNLGLNSHNNLPEMSLFRLFQNGPRFQEQTWRDGDVHVLKYGSDYMKRMVAVCMDEAVLRLPEECLRLPVGRVKALKLGAERSRVESEDWPFVDVRGLSREAVWSIPDKRGQPGSAPPVAVVLPLVYSTIDVEESLEEVFKDICGAGGTVVSEAWPNVVHWYIEGAATLQLVSLVSHLMKKSVEVVIIPTGKGLMEN